MMNAEDLADEITAALGESDASDEVVSFAEGIVDELSAATAATGSATGNAISGMTGASLASRIDDAYDNVTSPQLLNYCNALVSYVQASIKISYADSPEYELDGVFSGGVGSAMATAIATAVPFPFATSKLIAKCTAIVNHIHNNATASLGVIS